PLLTALKNYLIELNAYIKAEFQYKEINLSPAISWKQFKPKQVIFCEGHSATSNPWFSALPFQLVKGEIITAVAEKKPQQFILNYGQWFIPLDNFQFRTGASFDRENINLNTTDKAKTALLASLKQVYPSLTVKQITQHQAGIRPTTQDKMPFIGQHPHHSKLFIFNGFGAKGSLQIPWHCQNFADHLLYKQDLSQTSNINRYYSLF
ncbi:MAG: FAD-dependent oxidoreductase, partial [Methylococcales bacterium]